MKDIRDIFPNRYFTQIQNFFCERYPDAHFEFKLLDRDTIS